ncbi:hypothetical protein GJAV_G00198800 [Gymnothorax javanicus]|nr:hypothetical protein GJAV_G00198800 [Gymnothorax javanicus]
MLIVFSLPSILSKKILRRYWYSPQWIGKLSRVGPCLLPVFSWDRLQLPRYPSEEEVGVDNGRTSSSKSQFEKKADEAIINTTFHRLDN